MTWRHPAMLFQKERTLSMLIVGASVAGVRTAQALRSSGYTGKMTLLGEERHRPYDRPPLSKAMLAPGTAGPPPLLTAEELTALDVDLQLGVRAERLDPVRHVVVTADGRTLTYSHLVIATGSRARTLPGAELLTGVHTLRTADDAIALRAALGRSRGLVVIGAGFIGAEFASAARAYGHAVSVIERLEVPMSTLLGDRVGAILAGLHTSNGVRLLTGVAFDHFEGRTQISGVALSDGRVLPADLVVIGIGAYPVTDWLATSGLPVSDGVECDEHLRVQGYSDIHAVGDVARWRHPLYRAPIRMEHWTNANDHAAIVAADVMGRPAPRPQVPYIWSEQYDHRIQIAGRPDQGALACLDGDAAESLEAIYIDEAGTVVGAVVVDNPRAFMRYRKAIGNRVALSELST